MLWNWKINLLIFKIDTNKINLLKRYISASLIGVINF